MLILSFSTGYNQSNTQSAGFHKQLCIISNKRQLIGTTENFSKKKLTVTTKFSTKGSRGSGQ
jgi:hypothetical protein